MLLLEEFKAEERILWKSMRMVAVYSFLASICMLAMPAFMMTVFRKVLVSRSVETLGMLFIIAFVFLVAYGVFDAIRNHLLAKAGIRLESKMAGLILAGELSRQSDTNPQSVRDLAAIRQVIASPTFGAIFDLPVMPLFMMIIFAVHFGLGMIVLGGAVVLVLLTLYAERKTSPYNRAQMDDTIKAHQTLESHMQGQELIKAQGMFRESVNYWGHHQRNQLNGFLQAYSMTTSFSAATKSIRQILQITIIGVGALLVLNDLAGIGAIFAISIIGARALAPIEAIVGGWRNLKQAYESSKRLKARLADLSLPEDRTQLPRPLGHIGLEKIAYTMKPGMPPIIRGVSGMIAAGDSVAIVGPSGAGKSTLARLMVGYLEPSAGRVTLDGQDLKAWDPIARGLHVGYVPQQVTFFEASIRENIARLRCDDATDLAIEAAKSAGVHDIILKFPQGYDTHMSKEGFWPSGGQAQLIALARAFYANPAVLVLDEPNSALDTNGERIFHQAMRRAKEQKKTTVVVTQRPSVLQFVDKVLSMQDGIVQDITKAEDFMKKQQAAKTRPQPGDGGPQKALTEKPAQKQQADKDEKEGGENE